MFPAYCDVGLKDVKKEEEQNMHEEQCVTGIIIVIILSLDKIK